MPGVRSDARATLVSHQDGMHRRIRPARGVAGFQGRVGVGCRDHFALGVRKKPQTEGARVGPLPGLPSSP